MTDIQDLHFFIAGTLAKAQRVGIVSHVYPDGDAVGSVLGLGLALESAGKQVWMALAHGVPEDFRFLPGAERVLTFIPEDAYLDVLIAVDSGSRERLGEAIPPDWSVDINIDHHATNTRFATLNFVEPEAPSTTAILARYLPTWGFPLNRDVATVLLAGLVTDTLGLRTDSVTPDTMRLVATLMEHGAPLHDIFYETLVAKPFASLKYWGFGLRRMMRSGPLVWSWVTAQDRALAGYETEDDADVVNQLLRAREAQVSLIFVERRGPRVKMSWRAKPGLDMAPLAERFGGGGHAAAAGAILEGTMEEVMPKVLRETMRYLGLPVDEGLIAHTLAVFREEQDMLATQKALFARGDGHAGKPSFSSTQSSATA